MEEAAREGVVFYVEQAVTKPMPWDRRVRLGRAAGGYKMSIKNEKELENGISQLISQKNKQIPNIALTVTNTDIFYE